MTLVTVTARGALRRILAFVVMIMLLAGAAEAAPPPDPNDPAHDARALAASVAEQGEPLASAPSAPTAASTAQLGAAASAQAVAAANTTFAFAGHGQGHLRGMSQWGAYGYAVDYGWDYRRILAHYYGGTVAGTVGNSDMTVRLRAQTGRDLIVLGSSLYIGGQPTSARAVLIRRVGANRFQAWTGTSCTPSAWTKLGGVRTGPVVIQRPGQKSTDSATLIGVCEGAGTRYYTGHLRAVDNDGLQEAVAALPLETYLRGVVPRESPAYWGSGGGGKGINALRSQSVAARSYAMASTNSSFAKTCDTTECQVYGGVFYKPTGQPTIAMHSANSDRAIADTAGQVRWYSGTRTIVRTEFGASSGGWTAGETFPAVQDLGDDTTDATGLHNPYHSWTFRFSLAEMRSRLGLPNLTDLRVTATAGVGPEGGKATRIVAYTTTGTVTYDGDTIRRAFGLHSNWFRVTGNSVARGQAVALVWALHRDLWGASPSTAGLNLWVDRRLSGWSPRAIASAMVNSETFSRHLVRQLCVSALGAPCTASGTARLAGTLGGGASYWSVATSVWAGDGAYRHAGGTLTAWVTRLFRVELGRSPTAADLRIWTGAALRSGRYQAAAALLRSSAAGSQQVRETYRAMLNVAPSDAVRAAFAGSMPNRGLWTLPVEVARFPTYQQRADRRF